MSDTIEALEFGAIYKSVEVRVVDVTVARQLERELAECRAKLAELEAANKNAAKLLAVVEAADRIVENSSSDEPDYHKKQALRKALAALAKEE